MSLDVCFPSPCFNGGTCVTANVGNQTSFQCLCGALYVGAFCETRQKVIFKTVIVYEHLARVFCVV